MKGAFQKTTVLAPRPERRRLGMGVSEGEGKSTRDGRVGFNLLAPAKAVAGKRHEPGLRPKAVGGFDRTRSGRYRTADAL
jgi:hypothetical protein